MPDLIRSDATIAGVLADHPRTARVFIAHRMNCVGCAIAGFETLEEACAVYGISVTHLLTELATAAKTKDYTDDEYADDRRTAR